jgi:hypothetical protein
LTPEDLSAIEAQWRPAREEIRSALHAANVAADLWPQHLHWSWARKAWALRQTGATCSGLQHAGNWLGLMMTWSNRRSRIVEIHPATAPIIYIDYIEVSPENLNLFATLGRKPEFSAVGTRLLQHAVDLSIEGSADGRIGLHSLPISEPFYRKCGMTELGPDAAYDGLVYFELTPENAREFRSIE